MNVIEINNVSKSYGDFSINNLNMAVPKGSIVGLVGENGAGKSTLIKMMLDIVKCDSGEIKLKDGDNNPLRKEKIGAVLDEIGFNGCFSAAQIGKILSKCYKNWDFEKYDMLIKKFSLDRNKRFKEYSKGMKMKLGIAAAMSHNPSLLVLDEATSGLDPVVRDEITDIFIDFTRDENNSILMSSHIVSDLEKICDYIAFMHKGRLLLFEEKDVLRFEYAHINLSNDEILKIPAEKILGKRKVLTVRRLW